MHFSPSDILGRDINPKEQLNNTDLSKLLINYTSEKFIEFKDNLDSILKDDRVHFRNLVQTAVTGLCKRLEILEDFIINTTGIQKSSLEDIDLKLETFSSYQEHILYNQKFEINDIYSRITDLEKLPAKKTHACTKCDYTFRSNPIQDKHTQLCHETLTSDFSSSCLSESFFSANAVTADSSTVDSREYNQYEKDPHNYVSPNSASSRCDEVSPTESILKRHNYHVYGLEVTENSNDRVTFENPSQSIVKPN